MHVLQLVPRLEVGGVERGVLDLAKGLLARGHRVSVVSSGGALVEPLTRLGAAHEQLPVDQKSLRTMAACIPTVERLIRTQGVELVHARSRIPGWIGWIAARRAQRPFVTTAHGFYRPHPGSSVMVWGRRVIAPSEALGRYLIERFGLSRERLRIIPRGVDLEIFRFIPPADPHEGPWRIGLFGRLSALKGQTVAVQAAARLIHSGVAVRLCLSGEAAESPIRRQVERLIAALTLTEHVEWLGIRQDMPQLIASVDVVIVPSVYPESFGRSVIEAQAVGRPVVASRIGALAELISDGAHGLLVPPDDPEALAGAIARFIAEPSLRARCVAAGRRRVETEWTLDRMVERTLAVYDECLTRPRLLIWKLGALGDVVLATPSLRAIRRQLPNAHLTLAVGRSAYELVARSPYLDELLIYDPRRKDRGLAGRLKWLSRLRAGAFDLSVDLQNSRTTHLFAWLAGVPVRVGYRRKLGWLLNRGVRLPRVVLRPVAHQHYLLRQAGFAPDGEALEVWPSAVEERAASRLLAQMAPGAAEPPTIPAPDVEGDSPGERGRWRATASQRGAAPGEGAADHPARPWLVGLHPGGSGRWVTKRWDLDRWAQLADALAARNIQVLVTGGPQERGLGGALTRRMRAQPLVVIGQTSLMELACLIKRCDVFLAHDSAALHLATAVGTPTVALFGPTDPRRHLASSFKGVVIRKPVFCSPCYAPRCRTITHACMQRIHVDEVLRAVFGLLAEREAASGCAAASCT
jgi:ADP-heptose:LPS heptosyltransferase/glycosyltransferase involved in cell wall biosynthesis